MSAAPLTVGSHAPSFTLPDQHGRPRSLEDLISERAVLLVFFPFAFTGICTGELREIRDELGRFDNDRVHVAGISCDPMYSLRVWDDIEGFFFPLLSAFWPHGEAARAYGVWDEEGGFASRGSFLVDRGAAVRWMTWSEPGVARSFAGVDDAVAALPARR